LPTRSADQWQARLTSVIEDIRIWTDREGAGPAPELRDMAADYGGCGSGLASNILRRAGRLVDEGSAVSQRLTVPGSFVGAVYGEMTSTIMRSDGDPSASRWRMGAGREPLLVRYHIGHGTVAPRDQVQFKIAAAYRH
jgi:Xaa-Pro dipeptidase